MFACILQARGCFPGRYVLGNEYLYERAAAIFHFHIVLLCMQISCLYILAYLGLLSDIQMHTKGSRYLHVSFPFL